MGVSIKPNGFGPALILCFIAGCLISAGFQAVDRMRPSPGPHDGSKLRRLIAVSPAAGEWIAALGCGDRVIAVSDFCHYPPEFLDRPKIGGYINPNFELITALRPDAIVIQGRNEKLAVYCRDRLIQCIQMNLDDLTHIYQSVLELGLRLHARPAANRVLTEIRNHFTSLNAVNSDRTPVRTFICLNRSKGDIRKMMTVHPGSFLDQLLTIAGGENVFSDAKTAYPEVSLEAVMQRAPKVIIDIQPRLRSGDPQRRSFVEEWRRAPSIPAVRDNQVHLLTDDFILIPGPRMRTTVERIARILR